MRRTLAPILDPPYEETFFTKHRHLTRNCSPWSGVNEYIWSVDYSEPELKKKLRDNGYRKNCLSTLRYVSEADADGICWERGSFAKFDGKLMYHVYYFEASDNSPHTFHIHSHREWSYLDDFRTGRFLKGDFKHFSNEKRIHGYKGKEIWSAFADSSRPYRESPKYKF